LPNARAPWCIWDELGVYRHFHVNSIPLRIRDALWIGRPCEPCLPHQHDGQIRCVGEHRGVSCVSWRSKSEIPVTFCSTSIFMETMGRATPENALKSSRTKILGRATREPVDGEKTFRWLVDAGTGTYLSGRVHTSRAARLSCPQHADDVALREKTIQGRRQTIRITNNAKPTHGSPGRTEAVLRIGRSSIRQSLAPTCHF
jgi:hypothetical protein